MFLKINKGSTFKLNYCEMYFTQDKIQCIRYVCAVLISKVNVAMQKINKKLKRSLKHITSNTLMSRDILTPK